MVCLRSLVLALFAFSLINSEIQEGFPVPFDGACPNISSPRDQGSNESTLGIWYVYAASSKAGQSLKCAFVNRSLVNGAVTLERHQYNSETQQWTIFEGIYTFADKEAYIVYTYPYEFVIENKLIAFGPGFVATYTCSACEFYGLFNAGFDVTIYTRLSEPTETVRNTIWHLLRDNNITESMVGLTDHTSCTYSITHQKEH